MTTSSPCISANCKRIYLMRLQYRASLSGDVMKKFTRRIKLMFIDKLFRKTEHPSSGSVYEATEPLADISGYAETISFPDQAYLADEDENIFYIYSFPFIIGRNPVTDGNGLSLSDIPEVSAVHAVITEEKGRYYLSDLNSTNGTYMEKEGEKLFSAGTRLEKTELSDGCEFYIYRKKFIFHFDMRRSQTCVIQNRDSLQTASTVLLSECEEKSGDEFRNCDAYVICGTDGKNICLTGFPYRYGQWRIDRKNKKGTSTYFISSETQIFTEGEAVQPGSCAELFSGCQFTTDAGSFTFYIK